MCLLVCTFPFPAQPILKFRAHLSVSWVQAVGEQQCNFLCSQQAAAFKSKSKRVFFPKSFRVKRGSVWGICALRCCGPGLLARNFCRMKTLACRIVVFNWRLKQAPSPWFRCVKPGTSQTTNKQTNNKTCWRMKGKVLSRWAVTVVVNFLASTHTKGESCCHEHGADICTEAEFLSPDSRDCWWLLCLEMMKQKHPVCF